jgi:hypothetical protein
MIKLTVGLPVFNSKNIAWLAMEGLCRQKGIDFGWEIIVVEESDDNSCGKEFFDSYFERLKQIGCRRILYISLPCWVPLSQKWRLLGQRADVNSVAFVFQAADCYSEPNRLRTTMEAINLGNDWYKANQGLFYWIQKQQHILFSDKKNIQRGGLNMGAKTEDVRKLSFEAVRAKVDGWLVKNIDPKRVFINETDDWLYGVDTHGFNNISKKRSKFFSDIVFPFVETDLKIQLFLPDDIVERLKSMK